MKKRQSQKRIAYRPVLLTYIDNLGFRERIKQTQLDSAEVKRTYNLLKRLQQQYAQVRRYQTETGKKPKRITEFRSFSDLMIRVTQIQPTTDTLAGFLNLELLVLGNTQCDCVALAEDMLRGAIVAADLMIEAGATNSISNFGVRI